MFILSAGIGSSSTGTNKKKIWFQGIGKIRLQIGEWITVRNQAAAVSENENTIDSLQWR